MRSRWLKCICDLTVFPYPGTLIMLQAHRTHVKLCGELSYLVSLHIRSMWETTVMHKQVSGWTVNFGPNSPVYPFLELKTRIPPPPPFWKTSDLGWPKFTPKYPPSYFGKLQIWDDQSLLQNTPPPLFWKTSDLGWPKFTPKYPPHFGKLQIWDDQSLLWNTPPYFGKLQIWDDQSLLRNTPPILENFRFGMTKVYFEIPPSPPLFGKTSDLGWPKFPLKYPPPHFGKLQIWDDQSLLRNTPPILENFRFGMTKVYSEITPPPTTTTILENFRFGMTKVYSKIPPPPILENFRFGMTKVYSEIPPQPKIVREFKSKIFRIPRVTTCGDFIQPG